MSTMSTISLETPARWNNTGGDVTIHLVPRGTEVLVDPSQDEVWRYSFNVTTPLCGLGEYHGAWTYTPEEEAPLRRCTHCFAGERMGKPITTVALANSYSDARLVAERLKAERTRRESAAGLQYRIVTGSRTPFAVERFYNW